MIEDEKLYQLFQKHFEVQMKLSPVYATYLGYQHEKFDPLLPDGSRKAIEDSIIRVIQNKNQFESEINYNLLSPGGKLDYDLILYDLELSLFHLNEIGNWKSGVIPFSWGGAVGLIGQAIFLLYARDFAPLGQRVKAIISRLRKTPKFLEETKSTFIFPVKLWTEIFLEEGNRTIGFLKTIEKTLKPKISLELSKELTEAILTANESIKDYTNWLKTQILPKSTHEWVIGTQKFTRLVNLRKIGKTPKEILEIGERALKETKKELSNLKDELYPEKSVEEVIVMIKSNHPPTFEMVLEHVAELTVDARNFIQDQDLMDLPENEVLKVIPTPSFLRPLYPFAAYNPAEKFAEKQIGEYIVTPIEGRDDLLKEHSYANCKNVAVHEGYPGHHLQFTSANLQPNLVRSLISGSETIEGWAHYSEQLMAEKGFLGKDEIYMQLVGQIWRAVRIIVDVNLNTANMTFSEAKEFMMNEIGMAEPSVIAELKRYTFSPGYQFSYLLGKFMLLELREDIKNNMEELYSDKFFHNTILQNGGLPLHFLRRLFGLKIKEVI